MKQMLKYPLPFAGARNSFMFPGKASIKHVGWQDGQPKMWAEVEPNGQGATVIDVHCFGTGWDIPDNFEHIGTLQDLSGFVWHYYAECF